MKRLLTAVLLLVAAAAVCVAAMLGTAYVVRDMTAEISRLKETSADFGLPDKFEIERVCGKWELYSSIISIYTRHDEVERVSEAVELLPALAEEGTQMLFRLELADILASLEHLNMTELPSLSNIL